MSEILHTEYRLGAYVEGAESIVPGTVIGKIRIEIRQVKVKGEERTQFRVHKLEGMIKEHGLESFPGVAEFIQHGVLGEGAYEVTYMGFLENDARPEYYSAFPYFHFEPKEE